MNVGVVGYCPPTKFDEKEALRMICEAYDRVVAMAPGQQISIVSGLTNVGVLKIAYDEAERRGWRKIGVACKKAMEHPLFPVDESVIVGDNWGDESKTFIDMLNAIIRIGTGAQSIRETEEVKRRGLPAFEYDLPALLQPSKEKWPPLDPGTVVKTTQENPKEAETWLPEARARRRWGVQGTIVTHHDSHGLYYEVRHPDGTIGGYDPTELEVVPQPQSHLQGEKHVTKKR